MNKLDILSWIPRTHMEKPDAEPRVCNPSTSVAKMGGGNENHESHVAEEQKQEGPSTTWNERTHS